MRWRLLLAKSASPRPRLPSRCWKSVLSGGCPSAEATTVAASSFRLARSAAHLFRRRLSGCKTGCLDKVSQHDGQADTSWPDRIGLGCDAPMTDIACQRRRQIQGPQSHLPNVVGSQKRIRRRVKRSSHSLRAQSHAARLFALVCTGDCSTQLRPALLARLSA